MITIVDGVAVNVRDLPDPRGVPQPDLGSIIAYALASPDYDNERRRLRVAWGEESIPLTLTANDSNPSSSIRDERSCHVEVCFSHSAAQFYVKVRDDLPPHDPPP